MKLEDKLASLSVRSSDTHRDMLRARLLANQKGATMKRHPHFKRWLVLAAVPAMAVLLLVAINVFVNVNPKSTNKTAIEKIVEPLTAKQVFAAASARAKKDIPARADEVFYQKVQNIDKEYLVRVDTCAELREYAEKYTSQAGATLKDVRTTLDGRVIESVKWDEQSGKIIDDSSHVFNQSLYGQDATNLHPCLTASSEVSQSEQAAYEAFAHRVNTILGTPPAEDSFYKKPEGFEFVSDLLAGDIRKQAKILGMLQDIPDWKITHDVSRSDLFNSKAIEVSYVAGPHYYLKLYFRPSDKSFMGVENMHPLIGLAPSTTIVIEQGIRSRSSAD